MSMLTAALRLAQRGLCVFPCRPADKKPATPNGLNDATRDTAIISAWWQQQPLCNVAIATGKASGIWVLDVDDAEHEISYLEAKHGPLPATVESVTARGRHVFFRLPPGREVRNSAGRLAPGLDVRGDGGFVIVPPSLHPTGRRYAWSVDSANSFADSPAWLLDAVAAPVEDATPTPVADWIKLIRDGAAEGCRNDSLARLAGHLLRRLDAGIALELVLAVNARCRPPLRYAEVRAIVNSIAALELKRRIAA